MTQSLTSAAPTALPARAVNWRRWYLAGLTALTAYSTGVGWQAQLVSYPFFGTVPAEHFAAYHQQYNQAIPVVVILPGFLSFLAGVAFLWTRPRDVPRPAAAVVAGTGLVSLLATVLWAIPMHDRLDQIGQSAATLDSLLQANLVRSLALTAGTAVLVWCVAKSGRR
jgi:hypothetical protein